MKVADFGCGVGVVTRMLAKMVGPSGNVTGIDVNKATVPDLSGRPQFLVENGLQPLRELIG